MLAMFLWIVIFAALPFFILSFRRYIYQVHWNQAMPFRVSAHDGLPSNYKTTIPHIEVQGSQQLIADQGQYLTLFSNNTESGQPLVYRIN
jgi:hypothetical protein